MDKIAVWLPEEQIALIDEYVEDSTYDSRSEYVREILCETRHTSSEEILTIDMDGEMDDDAFTAGVLDRYLTERVDTAVQDVLYESSASIADDVGVSTKTVSNYIREHRQSSFPRAVSIEPWGGQKTTWEIRAVDDDSTE